MRFSIEGLPDWIVKPPVVSADLYKRAQDKVVSIETPHKHVCLAQVRGWTLPGVATVVEWTPT